MAAPFRITPRPVTRPFSAPRVTVAAPSTPAAPPDSETVHLAEVLGALSYALDLTDGQPPGHTLRACLVGLRLADEVGLPDAERTALYYAILLKDAGCSSNAARMASLFGADDQRVKPPMKVADMHRTLAMALATARNVAPGQPFTARVRQFLKVASQTGAARDIIRIRCDRGAGIARGLGFPEATAGAIRSLDEHWCGRGYPDGLRGDAIPLLARITLLAQTVEVFFTERGVDAALAVVRDRRCRWFDPRLCDVVAGWRGDTAWWESLRGPDALPEVIRAEPTAAGGARATADGHALDQIARSFADIIDAKSPFTFRHSTRVADLAVGAAAQLGHGSSELRRIHRAGLLHDIGKLGVSNRILDKPGRLTDEERRVVERHPVHTAEILERVGAFRPFARLAALHHEKLDGSGYPYGVGADALDQPARILAVADIYEALTADRPYRAGMSHADALAILGRDRGTRLCATAIDALVAHVEGGGGRR